MLAQVTYKMLQKFHSFDETQLAQIDPSTGEFQLDYWMVLYGTSPERVELVRCQNLRLRFAWLDPYLRTLQALTKYQLGERTFEQVVHRHKEAYFRDQNFTILAIL